MHQFLTLALTSLWHPLLMFARGGGGGSGGGGGGGGGGSGGGGGGGGIVGGAFMVGYLPTHFLTQFSTQHWSRRTSLMIGSIAAFLIGIGALIIGSITNGAGGFFFGIIVTIGAGVGVYTGLNNVLARVKERALRSKKLVEYAARTDPVWQEQALQARVQSVFMQYQQDWTTFNLKNIQSYTTPEYFQHVQLMLTALYQMGRQNVVENPKILQATIVDVIDQPHNDDDMFSASIHAQANDKLIDTQTNTILSLDNSAFEELWWFDRDANQWLLKRIEQATADASLRDLPLQHFAEKNGMFYSLDWGWLLLPQRGQLFNKAQFKESDINNHCIGEWNGNIVQLYTYIPAKRAQENYLIAQITLPKSYGGIIIKRKKGWQGFNLFTPSGYRRVTMEWPDFNNQYTVYATDMDKVTSFELLNPKFMTDLYDKNLGVSIEVVDNIIYLYAETTSYASFDNVGRYNEMLDVLQAAFKELRM